jgi:hypothetical protein
VQSWGRRFWAGGSNEDSSAELIAVNGPMRRYFVCLHVPYLNALTVTDPDGPCGGDFLHRPEHHSDYLHSNTYSREYHRGEGLAEALVNTATMYWLEDVEGGSRKMKVTLFVEPENAPERVYRKCGLRSRM